MRAVVMAAVLGLAGCAFTSSDGIRSYGIFPIAAPEPDTITIDKALTVAGKVAIAGYGELFLGLSSGLRARVPVCHTKDGRWFIPKLSTRTEATTSFQGGTTVIDGVTIDGFTEIPAP